MIFPPAQDHKSPVDLFQDQHARHQVCEGQVRKLPAHVSAGREGRRRSQGACNDKYYVRGRTLPFPEFLSKCLAVPVGAVKVQQNDKIAVFDLGECALRSMRSLGSSRTSTTSTLLKALSLLIYSSSSMWRALSFILPMQIIRIISMDSFPMYGSPAPCAKRRPVQRSQRGQQARQNAVYPRRAQSAPVSAAQTHFTSTLVIVYRARDFVNGRGEVLAHFFVTRLCRSEWDLL